MPEEETGLPGEMKETGTHIHHEEPTVMPEMFGEKGEKFRKAATKRSVMGALGMKKGSADEVEAEVKKIKSPTLQKILIEQLKTPEQELQAPGGVEIMMDRSARARNLIVDGELDPKEEKIADRFVDSNAHLIERFSVEPNLETFKKKDRKGELPKNKEKRRKEVIEQIEVIESTKVPLAQVPGFFPYGEAPALAQKVMAWIEQGMLDEDLEKEALARLRLHHCSVIAASIPGKAEEAGDYCFKVFESPESEKYALEAEDFKFLFSEEGEKIHGFKIRDAWNFLQTAATKGHKIEGENIRYLGEYLSATERKSLMRLVHNELVEIIPPKPGTDREDIANRSLSLAEKLAIATKEISVWNIDFVGNDPIAEAIYLRKARLSGRVRIKDKGAPNTIHRIEGIGSSFFRFTTDRDKKYLTDPELDLDKLSDDPNPRIRIDRFLQLTRAPRDEVGKLQIEDLRIINPDKIDFNKLPSGAYVRYISSTIPRIIKARELLLQTTWDPLKDIKDDAIESWLAPFDTVDPYEVTRLKTEFLLGVFYSIYHRTQAAVDLHWDRMTLVGVINNLMHTFEMDNGTQISFVDYDQMMWIKKTMKKEWGINIDRKAIEVALRTKVSKRVI